MTFTPTMKGIHREPANKPVYTSHFSSTVMMSPQLVTLAAEHYSDRPLPLRIHNPREFFEINQLGIYRSTECLGKHLQAPVR